MLQKLRKFTVLFFAHVFSCSLDLYVIYIYTLYIDVFHIFPHFFLRPGAVATGLCAVSGCGGGKQKSPSFSKPLQLVFFFENFKAKPFPKSVKFVKCDVE